MFLSFLLYFNLGMVVIIYLKINANIVRFKDNRIFSLKHTVKNQNKNTTQFFLTQHIKILNK